MTVTSEKRCTLRGCVSYSLPSPGNIRCRTGLCLRTAFSVLIAIKYLAHLAHQSIGPERLLNERGGLIEHVLVKDRLLDIAGHVKHFHLRPQRRYTIKQGATAHPRHHHVRQHKVNQAGMLLAYDEGLVGVTRFQNCVAV